MATKQKQTEDKKVKYRTEEKDKEKKKHKHELLSLAHGGRRRVYYLSVAEKLSGRPKKKSVSDESFLAASPEKSASAKSSVSAHSWLFWDQNPCPTKPPFPNRLPAHR